MPQEEHLLMTTRVRWHARWVVPVAAPPIADGTVITEDDRIVWVGPRATAPQGGRDEELGEAFLTPGLVNAHTHLNLTMMRGLLEELPFFEWVRTLTRATHEALVGEDFLDAAMLGIAEGLASGVTTYGDTAPSEAPFEAMLRMGVRGIAFREVFGPDPKQCEASIATLRDQVAAMRPRATPLVRVGISPHAPYSVSDALFAAVARLALEEMLPVAVHIAESADEQELVTQGTGQYADFLRSRDIPVVPRGDHPMQIVERAGLLRAGTLLIHCVRVDASTVRGIAAAGCGVAHCPASNARFGHGIAPLHEMLRAGVRVGLGSDSMASNNRIDLLEEARLASHAQRVRHSSVDAVNAKAAFRLATLGGAEALRVDDEVGSLEIGKQADLAVFAIPPHGGPVMDPHVSLVFGPRPATQRVIVAGVERVRDGIVLDFDSAIAVRVQDAAHRLDRWRTAQPVG
jgi:cytosine/adenosine deaminase-related metal-dependent hydrolase